MSGHSKWHTIKRKKGATDAKRGKLFTKLIREVTIASRLGGGDPDGNPRLRKAIADARAQAMPNETITRAIKRGTGEIEGASYEEVLYEGTGPSGILFIVESTTDNRNRTVAEIRKIFERNNGALGSSGTATWAFDRMGQLTFDKGAMTEEAIMDVAVGAGAEDYEDLGEDWLVTTPLEALEDVLRALDEAGVTVKESGPAYVPKTKKAVTGRDAELVLSLSDGLDDHDDVQNVFSDFDISDDELERIAGE